MIRRLLMAAALAGAAFAQPASPVKTPPGHPETGSPGRLEEASRLTERIAGSLPAAQAAAVPRRNLIDEHLFGKMERDGIPHAPLATDEEFLRRVYLDLTGRIPDSETLEQFLASTDPQKRDRVIDSLVGSHPYLAKWTHWWLDLSRSVGGGIGTQGRNLYYDYIYDAFQSNRPYHELVTDLLTVQAYSNWYVGPATYLVRSYVLATDNTKVMHEDTADEMTINSFRHFLGLNLQCIACHDGARHLEKINLWLAGKTRRDFWSQAAFFGETRLTRRTNVSAGRDEYRIEDTGKGYDAGADSQIRLKRTGKGLVEPVFILTGERPRPGRSLRQELARMITSHPQFARATVNLFWSELMGVGLVDPTYDFDLLRLDPRQAVSTALGPQTSHYELLEALAEDFRRSGYNLQRLVKLITQSSAYQLSARFPGEWKASYAPYFARRFVRRLSAEQLYDSIVTATGRFTEIPVRGSHLRVKYLTEIRCPEDINQNRRFDELQFFLESFGQANRRSADRSSGTSVTQAVLLLNSPVVREKVQPVEDSFLGRLLSREKWSDGQIVEKLFLRFLSRRPDAEEKRLAVDLLARKGQKAGGADLQWALVNKLEFIFNQ